MSERTDAPHPHLARLLRQYARDLAHVAPSDDLDARLGRLVADPSIEMQSVTAARPRTNRRTPPRHALRRYSLAAGIALLAIGLGVVIGIRLEHSRGVAAVAGKNTGNASWPAADLTMWPTDSVSFQIPAEYSAQGTLVAVDPNSKASAGTRYWIAVIVSNDGTFRIQRIVPAESHTRKSHDGQSQTP